MGPRLWIVALLLAVRSTCADTDASREVGDSSQQKSMESPELRALKERQATLDAEWTPMDVRTFDALARLRGAEKLGMDIKAMYKQLDSDSSGDLSRTEAGGMRSLIAARQKQVDQERASQDMTDYAEFAKLFEPGGEYHKASWLEAQFKPDGGWPFIFNRLDVDGDRLLSPVEISYLSRFLGLDAQEVRESQIIRHIYTVSQADLAHQGLKMAIDDELLCK